MLRWPERGGDEAAVAGRGSTARGGGSGRSREEVGEAAGAREADDGARWLEAGAGRGRPERGRSGDGGGGQAGAATVVAGRASPETRAKKTMRERLLDLGAVPLC